MAARTATATIQIEQLRQIALTGVRRAAAFLAVGLQATTGPEPATLNLAQESSWRFFPEPLPAELARETQTEFRAWIVGNALRELDAHFNTFLDELWANMEWSKLHGQTIPSGHTVRDISGDTNAASKLKTVLESLGALLHELPSFRSLSMARNVLTHGLGIVRPRHAPDGTLRVRWLGLDWNLEQNDVRVYGGRVLDLSANDKLDRTQETSVFVSVVERERVFRVGERVLFSPMDLHEICFTYQRTVEVLLEHFITDLRRRGIIAQPT